MALAELLSSVLSGGATGLLGAAVSRWADFRTKKLELEHEGKMKEIDLKIMAEEWSHRTQIASVESEAKVDQAELEAFSKSFNEPERYTEGVKVTKNQGWILVLLDGLRGAVRPGLTVYLCAITSYLYWDAHRAMETLGVMDVTKLVNQIVNTVLYLTTVCVCWWFGTRVKEKK